MLDLTVFLEELILLLVSIELFELGYNIYTTRAHGRKMDEHLNKMDMHIAKMDEHMNGLEDRMSKLDRLLEKHQ